MTDAAEVLGREFVARPDGTARLLSRAERAIPDRGGCDRCRGGGSGLPVVGHAPWMTVLRCPECGGYRLRYDKGDVRATEDEARRVLAEEDGLYGASELPDIVDVVAEPTARGADGRWTLPSFPEGLDAGSRGGSIWTLECLAALADILHGGDPGTTGRVYRARFVSRRPGDPHPFQRAYGLLLDVPLDADRLWDVIDYRPVFHHDKWPRPAVVIPDWTHPGIVGWIGLGGIAIGSQAGSIRSTTDAGELARWNDPTRPSIDFSISGGS